MIPDAEPGDFDRDGNLTAADIDFLSERVRTSTVESTFDLNYDLAVDRFDHEIWVKDIVGKHFGDAELNGAVEFADFLQLSANFGQPTGWAGGDFDDNGVAEFADVLLLSDNFGKIRTASVPEPNTGLLLVGMLACVPLLRRRPA